MVHHTAPEEQSAYVFRLYERLLEIEQRLIPTGLHVFGRAHQDSYADVLRMVASFDRPELGVRSLPDLVAASMGLPDYQTLLNDSARSEARLRQREFVEAVVREAVDRFLAAGARAEPAIAFLADAATVPETEARPVFGLLSRVAGELSRNQEMDSLARALRGEYIEPGPGADVVQNPDILPTGRNTYAINPYSIPSHAACRKSEPVVKALLERCRAERRTYPETIGMVLWGMDNIKTQGEGVAQALWLLGMEPRRDHLNRVTDVSAVPLERLGRPRIDVVMTVSGIFRDLFGTSMEVLDRAVRRAAALNEPEDMNFVRKHVAARGRAGASFGDAATRVFSNAPGSYGTNVNFMVSGSQWERAEEIGDLFITRKCFAFGRGLEGAESRRLMEAALAQVEVTYQNIDSAEVGITDVDHYFEYLGAMTQAVSSRAERPPQVYLSDALAPAPRIRSLGEVVRLETRTKTLNPKWYEGMLKHGYGGVAEIEHHVTNTFGWSATAGAVDDWIYQDIAERFLLDDAMLERLRSMNPHATRSMAARLVEAHGKGFWRPSTELIDRLRGVLGGLEDEIEGVGRSVSNHASVSPGLPGAEAEG
jgi:magnesium chelatase subunit H